MNRRGFFVTLAGVVAGTYVKPIFWSGIWWGSLGCVPPGTKITIEPMMYWSQVMNVDYPAKEITLTEITKNERFVVELFDPWPTTKIQKIASFSSDTLDKQTRSDQPF